MKQNLSKIEIAYEFVEKKAKVLTFKQIWDHVCKEKGLSAEEAAKQVSIFYTTLLQDGRFVSVGDGKFDLKAHYTYAQIRSAPFPGRFPSERERFG